jgi:anti-anti-sigma factor
VDAGFDSWREEGALVVAPRGDLDLASAPSIQAALQSLEPDDRALVLDLRKVDFLDTSGIRIVVEARRLADTGGYRFAVVRGSPRIHRIFEIAGLDNPDLFVDDPAELIGGDARHA